MARKLGLTLLALALGAAGGAWLSRVSWQKSKEQRQIAANAEVQMDEALAKQAELAGKKARYENPSGREELARSKGYRKPNELELDLGK